MPFLEIVYASAAEVPFGSDELVSLLRVARRNNASVDVTGILLFIDGSFLQVLEGPPDAVESIYEKVSRDPRHGNLMVLRRAMVEERSFEEWTMGFVDMSGRLDGFTDFLRSGVHGAATQHASRVLATLKRFRSGRFRRHIR